VALVIQEIDMTPDYVPYERPPQPQTLWSAIPRGLQSFLVDTQVLDLKPVGDSFRLNLKATLPPNFGYVMADMNVSIAQDRAFDWDAFANLNLQNYYRAPVDISVGLSSDWVQDFLTNSATGTRALNLAQAWPTFPLIGAPGTSGALVVLSISNSNATAATAGTVNAYASFWQFDLEQIRKYPINSPQPVHSR